MSDKNAQIWKFCPDKKCGISGNFGIKHLQVDYPGSCITLFLYRYMSTVTVILRLFITAQAQRVCLEEAEGAQRHQGSTSTVS